MNLDIAHKLNKHAYEWLVCQLLCIVDINTLLSSLKQ